VKWRGPIVLGCLAFAALGIASGQNGALNLPRTIEAGSAFSIPSSGSGKAVLYIVGQNQVLRRDVQLGEATSFAAGTLFNSGHYLVILAGASTSEGSFDVVPGKQPAKLSFFAKPSRLPVGLHNGISGAVYLFDAYNNLITAPTPVSFELTNPSSAAQAHTVVAHDGAAWTLMDSTPKEGADKFSARADGVSSTRVVEQVPGDPCSLRMSARKVGDKVELKTDPVRDCSGNAVPDGTVVTFTESYDGTLSTVDVPLKLGTAQAELPAHDGAKISVASGVVLGNEINWNK
jgi:hypothetical protein